MHIIEHTSERLIIGQRRWGMAVILLLFTIFSALSTIGLVVQGLQRLTILNTFQAISWVIMILFAIGFTAIGALMTWQVSQGMRCVFDKVAESYHLTTASLRPNSIKSQSLYSISHIAIEENELASVFGVFLVLRSGERVVLASVPSYEETDVRQIARTVREFLLSQREANV